MGRPTAHFHLIELRKDESNGNSGNMQLQERCTATKSAVPGQDMHSICTNDKRVFYV